MLLNRERFAAMLDPVILRVYEAVIEKGDDYVAKLFDVRTSTQAWEKLTGIGAADLPKKWEGQVHYGDIDPLWDKTFVHVKYSTGLKFERELWEDSQHNEIKNRINSVMLAVHRFRQLHAHVLFNAAFSSQYSINGETFATTGPDGQPLCSDSHPLSPSNSATQSNKGTNVLTIDNLEAARVAMFNFTDDKGQKLLIVPDTLIVPPALEQKAREIVYSVGRADTADRADNVRKNAYEVITLPLLTDSNAWFLVDSKLQKQYSLWFDRRKPIPEKIDDFDTEVLKHKVVMRFSYGWLHWAWVYGNNPD